MITPLAYVVFFTFPLLAIVAFAYFGRLYGFALTVIAGYLFLPYSIVFRVPGLPNIEKDNLIYLCAGVLLFLSSNAEVKRRREGSVPILPWIPKSSLGRLLILAGLAVAFLTYANNQEPVVDHISILPALAFGDIAHYFYQFSLPIFLMLVARRYFSGHDATLVFLKVAAALGVIYGGMVIFEFRFSPQLYRMLYGEPIFEFVHVQRYGNYKAVLFMKNALITSIHMAILFVCAVAVFRQSRGDERTIWRFCAIWTGFCLLFTLSIGATLLGAIFGVLAFLGSRRMALLAAAVSAFSVVVYPLLRLAGVVPLNQIVGFFAMIDAGRSRSLAFRFQNEELLIQRADDKIWTGWGQTSRNQVTVAETGIDGPTNLIVDSEFVIVLGQFGLVGYLSIFGLLALPILTVLRYRHLVRYEHAFLGLALALSVLAIDSLVNHTASPIRWAMVGMVLGHAELLVAQVRGAREEAEVARKAALELRRKKMRAASGAASRSAVMELNRRR
ncbi:MAG: hypothetical protein AAGF76_15145 [Pseudomonadota bacterium]